MKFGMDQAIATIGSAPVGGDWQDALRLLTAAGGGWCGQLIGFAESGALQFDLPWGVDLELIHEFEQRGGLEPSSNPRARILKIGDAMSVVDDNALAHPDELRRHPFYDFYRRTDAFHCAIARIELAGGNKLLIAALRSHRVGPMGSDEVKKLGGLLPHLKQAAELQQALDTAAVSIALGMVDALGFPVFMLGAGGAVRGMSASAGTLLSEGNVLALRFGRLVSHHPPSDERLQRAIAQACGVFPRIASTIVINGANGPLAANVSPLAEASQSFQGGAVAMLAIPQLANTSNDAIALLQGNFRLTRAEAEIALDLARAVSTADIATRRAVSVATVRQQIKYIYAKTGANSRASLVRLVNSLIGIA